MNEARELAAVGKLLTDCNDSSFWTEGLDLFWVPGEKVRSHKDLLACTALEAVRA